MEYGGGVWNANSAKVREGRERFDGKRVKGTVAGVTTIYTGNYFEWTSSSMKKYYYAGGSRVAMRTGTSTVNYLLTDQLGSTALAADTSGNRTSEVRYKPWGEDRYVYGTVPTTYKFTGQRQEGYINLYWFNSRWYDPALGRFVSPDPIVPGVGEGGNPGAVGYLGEYTYSALTVDYHEGQFLAQLNAENNAKIQDPGIKLAPVPTITIAFDRYAYSVNNPVGYVDPSGHFAILAALAAITPVGWVAIGVGVAVTIVLVNPEVREAASYALGNALENTANGINAFFAKGEYVPLGLSDAERRAYGEAVHIYKGAWGIPGNVDVPKEILDAIAELIREGEKPIDAADAVDGPPEADFEDE